jgi:hypothetical protein
MGLFLNIGLSALIISTALWIAKQNPGLGGFVVSLPLSTLIVLALNRIQNPDPASGMTLAKSIFVAIPATLTFFVPFLLAEKLRLSFWTCYGSGVALLGTSYFVHRFVLQLIAR